MLTCLLIISLFLQTENQGKIPRVGEEGVEAPIFTKRVSPKLPKDKLKISSYIVIECVCRQNGQITDIKVLRGLKGNKSLALLCAEALEKWEFKAGKKDGVSSDVKMTLKIDFCPLH